MHPFKLLILGAAFGASASHDYARRQLGALGQSTGSQFSALVSQKKPQGSTSPRALFGRQEEECPPGEFLCSNGGCCADDMECFGANECCPIGSYTCGDWGCYGGPVICCNGWACPEGSQCAAEEGLCIGGTETITKPTPTPTPTPKITIRPKNCGGVTHTSENIQKAMKEGFQQFQSSTKVKARNGKKYPAHFGNYEDLPLEKDVVSPWYEFPILASGDVFDVGADQGPDRVIFNANGEYAGVITHTGAQGNFFVNCEEAGAGAKVRRAEPTSPAAMTPSMAAAPSSTTSNGAAARLQSSTAWFSSFGLLFFAAADLFAF